MHPVKIVPLALATHRSARTKLEEGSPFLTYWLENIADTLGVTLEEARRLQTEVPNSDAAAAAWHDGLAQAMAETEADVWRVYDQVVVDKDSEVFVRAISAVIDELEESTPLLMPLANALTQFLPTPGMTLWDVAERRRRLTYDFIAVDVPTSEKWEEVNRCEPHTADGATAPYTGKVIRWNDAEKLCPPARSGILPLFEQLYASLPVGALNDGKARYGDAH